MQLHESTMVDFFVICFSLRTGKIMSELVFVLGAIYYISIDLISMFGFVCLIVLRFLLRRSLSLGNQDPKYHFRQESNISVCFFQNASASVEQ